MATDKEVLMTDKKTNLAEIKTLLKSFRDERDWLQFHDLKNLAEAISIESSELLEHFLWRTREEVAGKFAQEKKYRTEISEELADVIIFCLNFANAAGFDVSKIILDKMKMGAKKYPVAKARGRTTKYDQL